MAKTTTIQISKEFKDYLDSVGKKNETYEEVLKRLIAGSK